MTLNRCFKHFKHKCHCAKWELLYKAHSIKSESSDDAEQIEPVESVAGVTKEVDDGQKRYKRNLHGDWECPELDIRCLWDSMQHEGTISHNWTFEMGMEQAAESHTSKYYKELELEELDPLDDTTEELDALFPRPATIRPCSGVVIDRRMTDPPRAQRKPSLLKRFLARLSR